MIDILNKKLEYTQVPHLDLSFFDIQNEESNYDFCHIIGQHHAKRALEIAAA